MSRLKTSLPESLAATVKSTITDWQSGGKMKRLWDRDASLWTGTDESNWLGWLDIVEEQSAQQEQLQKFAKEVQTRGFEHILLLGMGGSSLCPEVLRMTFGHIPHFPVLHVLDSTDPAQVKAFEHQIDISKTLFIVSSKSGSTLEPNIFKQYFFERAKQTLGAHEAGGHFIAITDPGSKMQQVAEADRFLHVFFGRSSIGGRYSALSNFGMIPAAAIGLDTRKFLSRAAEMVRACGPSAAVQENPGAALGIILGAAANAGRDKVTIITSPGVSDLGAWLEQLLAESTGKIGKGIIPVDRERLGSPEVYGNDRVFVYLRLENNKQTDQDAKLDVLEKAGQPVVRITMPDIYDLGAEFFRWEIATAVAGAIIGINAFNQPDVEASKLATRSLTSEYEKTGSLPPEEPFFEDSGMKLFSDEKNAAELAKLATDKS
ncbi:MAG: transaldolase, partial [Candidatus Sulfotelmatobacter sp.]